MDRIRMLPLQRRDGQVLGKRWCDYMVKRRYERDERVFIFHRTVSSNYTL